MTPCRLCLSSDSEKIDILNTRLKKEKLQVMVQQLFSLEVKPTDNLPTKICLKCKENVIKFYNFCRKVRKSQKYFNQNIALFNEVQLCTMKQSLSKSTSPNDNQHERVPEKEIDDYQLKITKEKTFESSDVGSNAENQYNLSDNIQVDFYDVPLKNYIEHENYYKHDDIDGSNSYSANFEGLEESSNLHSDEQKSNKKCTEVNENSVNFDHTKDFSLGGLNTEIFKNGKLALKGAALEDLVYRFYSLHCDLCELLPRFTKLQALFTHFESQHGTKGYVTCCNTQIYHRRSVYIHMARHIQPSAFQCPICKKDVSRPNTLKLHLQTHLPESEKPHKCDQCDRRYSCTSGLASHKLTHIPIEDRSIFECMECEKTFTLSTSFTGHMATVHARVKFLCAECGKTFQTKTNLTMHLLTHDPIGKHKMRCKDCGIICKNKTSLIQHLKIHTSDRLQCALCDFNTHLQKHLTTHMWVKHSDLKPHNCEICGKYFKLKSVLKTHMAQHTGERKFACSFCPKTFASSGNYYTHRKRIHADQYLNNTTRKQQKESTKKQVNQALASPKEVLEAHVQELARQHIKQLEQNKKLY